MNTDFTHAIQRLHDLPHQAVLSVTGGGSGAISQLLAQPGASRTLLTAYVPYSVEALQDFLRDWEQPHPCNDTTARRMAVEAFEIAHELSEPGAPAVGVACTASLATDREKQGDHRVHVAAQSANRTAVYSLTLQKGARSRAEEESVAAGLVLQALLAAAGVPVPTEALTRLPSESVLCEEQIAPQDWPELGSDVAWRVGMPQRSETETDPPPVVMPGSFNPLHAGHRQMAAVAADLTGQPVTLELSTENVDKPALDFVEVARRVAQFGELPYLVTRAPSFLEKSALFPGCTFVVGIDTLIRLADEDYYAGSLEQRDAAIEEIAGAGCRLLVFGRAFGEDFITLDNLRLPPALAAICQGVSESEFRQDISSSEIRESE